MLQDHTLGRRALAAIRAELDAARTGDQHALAAIHSYAAQYIELLRQHIWKEDNILFRMAQQVLEPEAASALLDRFHQGVHCPPETVQRHAAFAAAISN
jgi:hemerythrin-like domain-containing protein